MNTIETPSEYLDRLSKGINVRTKKDKVTPKNDKSRYNPYYIIDSQGRKKGRVSTYNPSTNSWMERPVWDYDSEWDYSNVRSWYFHKGHRSWGYGDEHWGWHPLPARSPKRRKDGTALSHWELMLYIPICFVIITIALLAIAGGN